MCAPTDAALAAHPRPHAAARVLETLQEFLSPLKLPSKITVKMDQCGGALTVPYKPMAR